MGKDKQGERFIMGLATGFITMEDGAVFHIRVRCARESPRLTGPSLAAVLLKSARFYHERQRWWVHLFLLMPDHWHALLSFESGASMSRVIGDWKKYHSRNNDVVWQPGYFDHRVRNHLDEFNAKHAYIRCNPVAKGLCAKPDDWPWQWGAIHTQR